MSPSLRAPLYQRQDWPWTLNIIRHSWWGRWRGISTQFMEGWCNHITSPLFLQGALITAPPSQRSLQSGLWGSSVNSCISLGGPSCLNIWSEKSHHCIPGTVAFTIQLQQAPLLPCLPEWWAGRWLLAPTWARACPLATGQPQALKSKVELTFWKPSVSCREACTYIFVSTGQKGIRNKSFLVWHLSSIFFGEVQDDVVCVSPLWFMIVFVILQPWLGPLVGSLLSAGDNWRQGPTQLNSTHGRTNRHNEIYIYNVDSTYKPIQLNQTLLQYWPHNGSFILHIT